MIRSNLLFKIVSAFLIIILTMSCNPKQINLSFETIEQDEVINAPNQYDNRDPGLIIISSTQEIVNAGDLISDSVRTRLEQTNYSDYFIMLIFQGKKASTGYGVNIERITQDEKTVNIYAMFKEPKPEEAKGAMVTSPYQSVQVKKSNGKWGQELTFNLVVDKSTVATTVHFVT